MTRSLVAVLSLTLLAALGCVGGTAPDPAGPAPVAPPLDGPRLRVLGTAQDGGLPHAACGCERCEAARVDPTRRRLVASAAIVLPQPDGPDRVWLVDATPDIRAQLDALGDPRRRPDRVDRAPVDGVLLTHAHLGHYTGLAFFGFEAVHTRGIPVVCTPAMASYLASNGPWSQLVELGNIRLEPLEPLGPNEPLEPTPGTSRRLDDAVRVTALRVPHRDEFADTVAWIVDGPRARLLYLPDTEPWARWPGEVEAVLRTVDVALIDGTFYSLDELPGRDVSQIGHPLIVDSLERLAPLVDGSRQLVFTHFNHSNPAIEPDSAARAAIERAGFRLAADGAEYPL